MTGPTATANPSEPHLLAELDHLVRGVRGVAPPPPVLAGWHGRSADEYAAAVHRLTAALDAAERALSAARGAA